MTTIHGRVIAPTWLNVLPAVLFAMGLGCLVMGLIQRANAQSAAVTKETPMVSAPADPQKLQRQLDTVEQEVTALAQQRDALKDRLDGVSQQAAHNQLFLSLLLAFAGLFTLLQGVFAFFSAQSYVKQADDSLAKIQKLADEAEKRFQALADEAKRKFPIFSQIEKALEEAFERLGRLASRLDLDENLYEKLDPITRQEILAVESFAATLFLASPGREKEVVTNLRLLGKFYADRFVSGNRTVESEFERALYYFRLGRDKSNHDICALNDLGWLYMVVAATKDLDMAKSLFEESLRINDNQQRPNYNLGTILFVACDSAKLTAARKYLEKAVGISNWEKASNDEFSGHVSYNLACTYSRLAELETDTTKKSELLDLAAGALDSAAANGGTKKTTLDGDLATGGDLAELTASVAHAAALANIRGKFSASWNKRAERH